MRKKNLLNQSFKYIHIFLHPSLGFNLKVVELICDPANEFYIDEHLFITSYQPLYDAVKDKCHIRRCRHPGHRGVDMINLYGDYADWLIVHSFPVAIHRLIFFVDRKYLAKIIWRTWGHDVWEGKYIRFWNQRFIKDVLLKIYSDWFYFSQKFLYLMSRSRLQAIHAVGIANIIDAINVRECYGLTRICWMPYPGKDDYKILQVVSQEKKCDDGNYHVMIGHSAGGLDRHCEVIKMLKRFENERMMLHVILSYGDENYAGKVQTFVEAFWNGKVEIIRNTVEFEEYAKYMNRMDAVILDGLPSYALGNLSMILLLRKKLFLNRDGVLQKGLVEENLQFHYTDEICGMSFEEFSRKEEYIVPEESTLVHYCINF